MKNTFNTLRKKERGKFPYIVIDENGVQKYLFEVTKKTSLSEIIDIEQLFNDDELIFASTDLDFSNHTSTIDACNIYEVGDRKLRPFYFYSNGFFSPTVVKELTDPRGGKYKRLWLKTGFVDLKMVSTSTSKAIS
ncbi:hypothetical protein [Flavobacterium sp.]|jgi:hypothetical protein|uniref:hypothetical protein n=1 Tax=Flavobacterium sp. TaxID=239 RepID=UPI0037C0D10D